MSAGPSRWRWARTRSPSVSSTSRRSVTASRTSTGSARSARPSARAIRQGWSARSRRRTSNRSGRAADDAAASPVTASCAVKRGCPSVRSYRASTCSTVMARPRSSSWTAVSARSRGPRSRVDDADCRLTRSSHAAWSSSVSGSCLRHVPTTATSQPRAVRYSSSSRVLRSAQCRSSRTTASRRWSSTAVRIALDAANNRCRAHSSVPAGCGGVSISGSRAARLPADVLRALGQSLLEPLSVIDAVDDPENLRRRA